MPNWCTNTVEINHSDPARIHALVEAVNAGRLCAYAIPVPEALLGAAFDDLPGEDQNEARQRRAAENRERYGHSDWYSFCVSRWGTKWDVQPYDTVDYDDQHDKTGVTFGFDSAWAPPIGVYRELEAQGYSVRAYYWEPSMEFAGVYTDGDDDEYDLTNMTSQQARQELPRALDEIMGISETISNYEEEAEDE